MTERKDEMALASALAKEVIEMSFGLLPLSKKESELILDRYVILQKNLLRNENFVTRDEDGFYFRPGFQLQELEDQLQLQLHELAAKWNANPVCMARALVVLPGIYDVTRNHIDKATADMNTKATIRQYKKYMSINKERLQSNSFEYGEKQLPNPNPSMDDRKQSSSLSTFTNNINL